MVSGLSDRTLPAGGLTFRGDHVSPGTGWEAAEDGTGGRGQGAVLATPGSGHARCPSPRELQGPTSHKQMFGKYSRQGLSLVNKDEKHVTSVAHVIGFISFVT